MENQGAAVRMTRLVCIYWKVVHSTVSEQQKQQWLCISCSQYFRGYSKHLLYIPPHVTLPTNWQDRGCHYAHLTQELTEAQRS